MLNSLTFNIFPRYIHYVCSSCSHKHDIFYYHEAIFEACCTSEETTATEVNTCLATLPVPAVNATTAATEPTTTVGATDAPVETTTTATAATEAAPTPVAAPSSGNIASVSFPMMIGYALFNYVM